MPRLVKHIEGIIFDNFETTTFLVTSVEGSYGEEDYIKTKERWGVVKVFFQSKDIEYKEVFSGDGNILTKLIRLIYLYTVSHCS